MIRVITLAAVVALTGCGFIEQVSDELKAASDNMVSSTKDAGSHSLVIRGDVADLTEDVAVGVRSAGTDILVETRDVVVAVPERAMDHVKAEDGKDGEQGAAGADGVDGEDADFSNCKVKRKAVGNYCPYIIERVIIKCDKKRLVIGEFEEFNPPLACQYP